VEVADISWKLFRGGFRAIFESLRKIVARAARFLFRSRIAPVMMEALFDN
jgi:hypothetical protein